ncbi:OBAP family protein [Methylocaldum sp.]|uniref:OBAP family protein n=1 Tax=Methylocaldum sp. TaxID=1969727 RepID=UPI002D4B0650|nr:OBAP family protein [Methylocaldum sp.]HYE36936.1 OBAP family protein [Methylocaldum sp.]
MEKLASGNAKCILATLGLLAVVSGCGGMKKKNPGVQPEGRGKTTKTQVLETGAAMLQSQSPLRPMDIYLSGFHVAKRNPSHQMEAHHYCHQVNEDFAQCVLFDGNTTQANLIGIEYIISETLFESLPLQEKRYWHPHNYEILSGQLTAPGIPETAEKALMRGKMNSYGKTWHVWNSAPFGRHGDKMPLGAPILEWSFNRDGEALPGLIEERDRRMRTDVAQDRLNRKDLVPLAKPQTGVTVLKKKFSGPTKSIPGVMDKNSKRSQNPQPVSRFSD